MQLVDAHLLSQTLPFFEVPSADTLANISPGSYVKVCANGERFWVCVESLHGKLLRGRVDNELVLSQNRCVSHCGDVILLHRRHVLNVLEPQDKTAFNDRLSASHTIAYVDLTIKVSSQTNRLSTGNELFEMYYKNIK